MTTPETRALLKQLEVPVEDNLDGHLASAEDWMPHEYIPWSQGRNFAVLDGEPWSIEQSKLSPIARTALEMNLLTEDNLPSYHRDLERTFGSVIPGFARKAAQIAKAGIYDMPIHYHDVIMPLATRG